MHATPEEVAKEVRAQIEKSIALGYRPDHIDTHMGTLYAHPQYAKDFLAIAMEYGIPANNKLMRATLRLSSPAWLAAPKMTSSTRSNWNDGLRSINARIT